MALKFQVRGTQLDAYYASAFKAYGQCGVSGPTLAANANTGVFGGSVIDIVTAPVAYVGLDNCSLVGAFTILIRVVPNFTGFPPSGMSLWSIGPGDGSNAGGLMLTVGATGLVRLFLKANSNQTILNIDSTAVSFTSGVPTDIWASWDGTTGGSSAKIFYAHNGNTPTQILSTGPSASITTRQPAAVSSIVFGSNPFGSLRPFTLNEACIWDTVEVPGSYGARSNFITASAFEGYSYTNPGIANVKLATNYTFAGAPLTGTLVVPSLADTKIGVAGDGGTGTYDGSDRWTDIAESLVFSGYDYKANSTIDNKTGTIIPGPTPEEVAGAVWNSDLADHTTAGTFGKFIQTLLSVGKFLGLK